MRQMYGTDYHTFVSYFQVFQMSVILRLFGQQLWNLAAKFDTLILVMGLTKLNLRSLLAAAVFILGLWFLCINFHLFRRGNVHWLPIPWYLLLCIHYILWVVSIFFSEVHTSSKEVDMFMCARGHLQGHMTYPLKFNTWHFVKTRNGKSRKK